MRERRPVHLPAAIDACAEHLPCPDQSFDATMGTFTVHQWTDLSAGLSDVRRVTRGPVAFLTCDPEMLRTWWLYEYFESQLRRDLVDGTWDLKHGHLRRQEFLEGALVLVVSTPVGDR
jgi:ubiquinone/menaquinone biosynthesis C-methylase UbiE